MEVKMKLLSSKIFWGLMLVIGGLILLLEQLGVLEGTDVFWIVVFSVAGILFMVALATNTGAWWVVIPGLGLIAVALAIGLDTFTNASGEIMGVVILGGFGLSFFIVYLLQRLHWWAIIPAGVLITLAIVAGMDAADLGPISGAVFFAGLGLTFALVALLPNKSGRMTWAWIPGGILLFMAVLIVAGIGSVFNYIWPAVLIVVGLFFLYRTFITRKS
jgi:hypothetical protein